MRTDYLNAIPSAIVAFGKGSALSYLNASAEDLFSLSTSQVIGRHINELNVFDKILREHVARVFSSGEEMTLFDFTLNVGQQPAIQVMMHITPIFSGQREVMEVMLTIEKTGGMKRLAANLLKHDATRAAGVMAAMMAHEVKNPLSGIRGAAQLLREEIAPEHYPLAELICNETDRIRDLLDQMEVFSGEAPVERTPVNIHEVLQYVISIAKAGFASHVTFREVYDPSLPPVLTHRDSIVQLFLNLIKNAAEATAEHRKPIITLSSFYRSGYRLGAISLPIAIAVEDNGPGIPPEMKSHIFEPLISSKEQGRGLGLAVVAKIASDVGAIVELDEERGEGARFLVMLPIGK